MTLPPPQHRASRPKVSVIIPTYESAGPLQSCLQSLRVHSYPHQEVIVVDGYSRDQTPDVAVKGGARVFQAKGSQARARNFGVAKATGDYVLFMDSDQTLGGDAILECVELCTNKGVQAVKIPETFYGNTYWSACSAFWRNHVGIVGGRQGGIPRFYERKCLLEAGLFNEDLRLWEDHDLYQRVKATGAKTAWCHSTIFHREPSSFKAMLAKSLRYGRSIPAFMATTQGSSTPLARITHLTLRSVLQSWRKNPLLATGCLIITALKASATLLGVLQSRLLNLVKPPLTPSSEKRLASEKPRELASVLV